MNRIVCLSADAPFPLSSQALFSFPSLSLPLRPLGDQRGIRQIGDGSFLFLCQAASPSPSPWACTAKQKIAMNVGQSQNGLGVSAWHRFCPLSTKCFLLCDVAATKTKPACMVRFSTPPRLTTTHARGVLRVQAAGIQGPGSNRSQISGPMSQSSLPRGQFQMSRTEFMKTLGLSPQVIDPIIDGNQDVASLIARAPSNSSAAFSRTPSGNLVTTFPSPPFLHVAIFCHVPTLEPWGLQSPSPPVIAL